MTPQVLSDAVLGALRALVDDGSVALAPHQVPRDALLERPRRPGRGDYATSLALRLAQPAGTPPRVLAGLLAERVARHPDVAAAEVAGPGFLNVRLRAAARSVAAADVVRGGADEATPIGLADLRPPADLEVDHLRYAHARAASLVRNAHDLDIEVDPAALDCARLDHDAEAELSAALVDLPAAVAASRAQHRVEPLVRCLDDVAAAFERFVDACPVLPRGEEPVVDLHRARLVLVAAARTVLANGLGLLGVPAPERM